MSVISNSRTVSALKADPRTHAKGRSASPAGSLLGFAALWSALITGLVILQLFVQSQALSARTMAVTAIFLAGSFLGAMFARGFAALTTGAKSRPSARFAAMFIGLAAGTAGMSALIHFLHYRSYYAEWHSDFGTIYWVFETLMTGLSAAYIFVVQTSLLLLPWVLVLLFAAAFDYARSPSATR